MGADINSRQYPLLTRFVNQALENVEAHLEPASELIKSCVEGMEHPLFSSAGLQRLLNFRRNLANAAEELLSGDIVDEVIQHITSSALNNRFPVELLTVVSDFVQRLDTRDGATDSDNIISDLREYSDQLIQLLGRQPRYFEIFMAHTLESAELAKQLIDRAADAPNDPSTPVGSEHDDLIFFKTLRGEQVPRTNKEVIQFFRRRMILGDNVFPHFPLGRDPYQT